MSPREVFALRDHLGPELTGRTISDPRHLLRLSDLTVQSCLAGRSNELDGRAVLLATSGQLLAGLAMIEIDGVARRMLLCPPDLKPEYLASVISDAEIDTVVTDQPERFADCGVDRVLAVGLPREVECRGQTTRATEWLMLTSGTSGVPKIVRHTLEGLCGAIIGDRPAPGASPVWATFYDIRRYGGLQIFLRAIVGGGSMVLSDPDEMLADHVARLKARGVTHMSGTPSHWRKLLMSGAASGFAPRYVRLSGEIADQAVLDGLALAFPNASIGHAYASTEAGVGFAVNDGREGFPAGLLGAGEGPGRDGVDMKVVDGSLRIRSKRAAQAYVGRNAAALTDADGFVDTGDMVELRGDRYYFVGRRNGIINVGGLKVHPEEIEAVINRHPEVRMARAKSRKSPITGGIVVADVVLTEGCDDSHAAGLRDEIVAACRASLAPHKVPAMIRFVPALDVTAAGKLARTDA
ncbi:putative 2-succinylbenzoate--CoA ligase (OSB-CoA synthetase) (o-succinylbenzoyl-CoA synthetase) [Bradyrhizobium sp. STM 3843]|uniref:class I adenylate-forming enzyme family protein n=1 Tax=Bradyrhizobium sp. STM 3843 TaxID=551947 RepID=UPI0002407C97|nr:fatty acid--CoA ligase family protein [Bradyrhizobium sp. STM 3843]CCE04922.1 putative 2-succinylbenzoate--CoA ligase (OSB-CoA synthetase) (o-succinylbenzoyl-CoA synthetase) [Bradyrhizobium sp. STM 3843]